MSEPVTVGVAIITRNDLDKLKDVLEQLGRFDQVVVVDTGSRDGTREHIKKLGPPFELHTFQWLGRPDGKGPDDWGFAAARNESFRHLRTTYGLWLDSDDLLANVVDGRREALTPDAAAAIFRKLATDAPENEQFLLDYLYLTDEFGNPISVLAKERFLKLDAGWRWRFPIHEMVLPTRKDIKDVKRLHVRDVFVVHRPHPTEESVRRNAPMLRAWLRQLEQTGAPSANVARARFLIARSLWGQGKLQESARFMLREFLGKHPDLPNEDKWEGWMDVAKALFNDADYEGAHHAAVQAIGLCPRFGEGYVLLAEIKSRLGGRYGDVLKLLEVAESCVNESYGIHERNPLLTGFRAALLGATAQLKIGHYSEALTLADHALEMRPADKEAREVWDAAAAASRDHFSTSSEPGQERATRTPDPAAELPPIFVVSSGRCGSTLLSNMLNMHPDILSLSEFLIMLMPGAFAGGPAPIRGAQFWAVLSTPRKRTTLMYRHGIAFPEMLYKPGPSKRFTLDTGVPPIMLTSLPHLTDDPESLYDEIHDFVMQQGSYPITHHYRLLFNWLRERFHRKVWVERSGSSMAHLSEMLTHFPDARFIHMFRDGRECAISMSKHSAFRLAMITGELMRHVGVDPFNTDEPLRGEVPPELRQFMPESFDAQAFWQHPLPVERLGGSWNTQERRGIEMLAQLPTNRVLLLRYENLVANPRDELTRVMRFIGASHPADYLDKAAAMVRKREREWPQLPPDVRERLDRACRTGMGLLYGSEEAFEPEPVAVQ